MHCSSVASCAVPPPEEVAAEIVENLETALERFRRVAQALNRS
jgi:type I restriction enzyme M protein